MAVEAIAWALKTPIKRSSTKFVLVVLGNCADGDSWEAFPSIGYICDSTALDRKTVVAALRSLSADGYIADTGERRGHTKQIPIYRLNRSKTGNVEQFQKRNDSEKGTVPKTDRNSTVFPAEESRFSHQTVPKTEHGTVNNRKGTVRGAVKVHASASVLSVFQHWQVSLKHPDSRLDARRAKVINRALDIGYSVDQLKKAVDGCAASEFHQGKNDSGKVYDALDLILRDAEHIDRFIALADKPPTGTSGAGTSRPGVHFGAQDYAAGWGK